MSWKGKAIGFVIGVLTGLAVLAAPVQAQKKTLVVTLNQDPDILDPTLSQSYVGRIVYANMCEKLYEIDENLNPFPQLAAAMPQFCRLSTWSFISEMRGEMTIAQPSMVTAGA